MTVHSCASILLFLSIATSVGAAGFDRDFDSIDDVDDNCVQKANTDQRDTDLDGYGNVCDADFNNDGTVTVTDFYALRAAWNSSIGSPSYAPELDMTGDGVIGAADFLLFKAAYLTHPGPSALPCRGTSPCPQPNFLFLLIDEVGTDKVSSYDGPPGETPAIDALAASGVKFTNAWASPSCSPARATALTGRYSFRTGIGSATRHDVPSGYRLNPSEPSIARTLGEAGYATAAFGKWHLSTWCSVTSGPNGCSSSYDLDHPIEMGFDYFEGTLGNLPDTGYCNWPETKAERDPLTGDVTVTSGRRTRYATRETVDDAIAKISTLPQPWFAWVAFNSAHSPFHQAPIGDPGPNCTVSAVGTPSSQHDTMVSNVDSEIARLLAALSPSQRARTTVIVAGDNGTPKHVMNPPQETGGKRSLYESGVHVPFIVTGPTVSTTANGATTEALVSFSDLFATLASLAGSSETSVDSVNFRDQLDNPGSPSLRSTLYSERFDPNGPGPYTTRTQGIRDQRFKLIRFLEGPVPPHFEAYDLLSDPLEQSDLVPAMTPAQRAAFEPLATELAVLLDDPCISLDDPEASCPQ